MWPNQLWWSIMCLDTWQAVSPSKGTSAKKHTSAVSTVSPWWYLVGPSTLLFYPLLPDKSLHSAVSFVGLDNCLSDEPSLLQVNLQLYFLHLECESHVYIYGNHVTLGRYMCRYLQRCWWRLGLFVYWSLYLYAIQTQLSKLSPARKLMMCRARGWLAKIIGKLSQSLLLLATQTLWLSIRGAQETWVLAVPLLLLLTENIRLYLSLS